MCKDLATMSLTDLFRRVDEIHEQIFESICAISDAKVRINHLAVEQERLMQEIPKRIAKQSAGE